MDVVEKIGEAIISVNKPVVQRWLVIVELRKMGVSASGQQIAAAVKKFEQLGILEVKHHRSPDGCYELARQYKIHSDFHERFMEATG